jgi:murein L,D-transpeptidase YcbB/YkuD
VEQDGGAGANWRDAARRALRRAPCAILAALLLAAAGPGASRADPQPQPPSAASVTDPDLRRLYEAQGWRALWTPEMRGQMARVLEGGVRHGLDAAPVTAVRKDIDTASDVALSKAALRYAQALAMGTANPEKLHSVFELRRNQVDLVAGLSAALASGQVVAWYDGLAPSTEEYRALSEAYVRARERARSATSRPVPEGPPLAPGANDPRILAIARRLVEQGYLDHLPPRPKAKVKGKGKPKPRVYSPDMVEAVKRLQTDYGLAPDGVVSKATLQALNGGARLRARTLAVNLERLRWLARDPPANRIDVNIAAAELRVYRDGSVVDRRKVIVGTAKHETPPLEASFSRLVVNPPWYVPKDIARREILPKGRGYMARNGMVMSEGRVMQKPGPKSALGQVKFDLQDDHDIYLHDTPTKALFDRAGRHLSHGCVRVEGAVGLAESLAGAAGRLPQLQEALASNATHTVDLGAEIPVRLLYLTAFTDGGAVRFARDAYGWDDDLAKALGLGPGAAPERSEASADLGP